jgi:hypothetical protein
MFSKIVDRIDPLAVITIDEAKDHLNIVDFYEDDTYIEALILTAGDVAEKYKKTLYSRCRVKVKVDPIPSKFFLPYSPVETVESVMSGTDEVDYNFCTFSYKMTIKNIPTGSDGIIITYVCGYNIVPDMVKHACKIIVADLYAVRESHVDVKMTNVMFNALRMLN